MIKNLFWITLLLSSVLISSCGGDEESSFSMTNTSSASQVTSQPSTSTSSGSSSLSIEQKLATSLHGSTRGMEYFYAKEQGGFEQFTHVAYKDLPCQNCHVQANQCHTCHEKVGDKPTDEKCLNCHQKQHAEQTLSPDYHMLPVSSGGLGMQCADCHTAEQVHGDGKEYNSLHQDPNKVNCEKAGCHSKLNEDKAMHKQHHHDLDCAACHVRVTPSCYGCHFTQQEGFAGNIVFNPPIANWKLLVKSQSTGKITTGGIQTVTSYQGQAFYTLAPYFAHTIPQKSGLACGDCHESNAVKEYKAKGTMTLVTWDPVNKSLNSLSGIIPIPLDWKTALRMDFLTLDHTDDSQWIYLKNAADGSHMLFADPINVGTMPKFE